MTPKAIEPPGGSPYQGKHKVWGTASAMRGWKKLGKTHASAMDRCYRDLADHPFPKMPSGRHHRLKANLKDFWEWEVGGGQRVRYKEGPDGDPVVVYAGPAPSDTH